MKKFSLVLLISIISGFQLNAQCTFESLFPLKFDAGKYNIVEYYANNPVYTKGKDTLNASVFVTGLDYFYTKRNLDLGIYSYTNIAPHPCFKSGDIVLNCVASDSGLLAYNYQVTYAATSRDEFMSVVDSLRNMMKGKFVYHSMVDNKTTAVDTSGQPLSGEGACVYYNDQPIVPSNLTYPQMVIRAGYLSKKPGKSKDGVHVNQAEEVQYYRIEILYKKIQPKW